MFLQQVCFDFLFLEHFATLCMEGVGIIIASISIVSSVAHYESAL